MPEGKGIYTFANGDIYTGDFKNGKKSGRGTYVFVNGTRQTGMFENGELIEQISVDRAKK